MDLEENIEAQHPPMFRYPQYPNPYRGMPQGLPFDPEMPDRLRSYGDPAIL